MRVEKKKNRSASALDKPLFSVIVLTYMQRHLLDECLNSILKQTYPNIELIICDDCSADFDPEEVEAYVFSHARENLKSLVVHRQERNVGTVANAQLGVELSSGEFFKLHAGDDMLLDGAVLDQMAAVLSRPDVKLVAARSMACQHDGTMTQDCYPFYGPFCDMMSASAAQQFEMIGTQSWGAYINAPAVFWKRSLFDKMGGFDLSYRYTEDWPMWLKITGAGHAITMVNVVTTIYRYGGISNDLSALNVTIGKVHYEESIRMLREIALPRFEAEGKRRKIVRCKHAIKCLEVRRDTEGKWKSWTTMQKISWRIKELPFLLLSWMYRKRTNGIELKKKGPAFILGVCTVLFVLHAEIWPGYSCDWLWAGLFWFTLFWLLIKGCFVAGIKLLRWILEWKRRASL